MTYELNSKYTLVGKVESLNQGDHFSNVTILLEDKTQVNIKTNKQEQTAFLLGKVYVLDVLGTQKGEEVVLTLLSVALADDVLESSEIERLMPIFYTYAPVSLVVLKQYILDTIAAIKNETIQHITNYIFDQYSTKFFMHPAATKFHHAYLGGLAYHTYQMLRLAKGYIEVYPYLNKDLLNASIIIHDIAKIKEITGVDGEYTTEGLLLGHLVLGVLDIHEAALKLNLMNQEEVLLLKHLMIAHHGQLNFGSPKKPQTAEALVLWLIDMSDAKLTVLGEVLDQTQEQTFTTNIPVLDKQRFYKSNKL